jgi:hypothetical protein
MLSSIFYGSLKDKLFRPLGPPQLVAGLMDYYAPVEGMHEDKRHMN